MAIPIDELVQSSALTYTLQRLTRGDSTGELYGRLSRRYPTQPSGDLNYLIELAVSIESAKAEIAAAGQFAPLGPAVIPFVPGLPAGEFQIDIAYQTPAPQGTRSQRGFFRLNVDNYDLLIGLLVGAGAIKDQSSGYWQRVRDLVTTLPTGTSIAEITAAFPDVFNDIFEVEPSLAARTTPVELTPATIQALAISIPEDEPERIILPPQTKSPDKRRVTQPQLLFVGRG